MENRIVKFYSKESSQLALHAIPGHFATSHSHINYYVDVTSLKSRVNEAREAAKVLYSRMPRNSYVDTIVCMDGTEVIAAFLSQEIEHGGLLTANRHETIYVVSPEINNNNQMLFRDNNKPAISGKHVLLLLATTTAGAWNASVITAAALWELHRYSVPWIPWTVFRWNLCLMHRMSWDMRRMMRMTARSVKKDIRLRQW